MGALRRRERVGATGCRAWAAQVLVGSVERESGVVIIGLRHRSSGSLPSSTAGLSQLCRSVGSMDLYEFVRLAMNRSNTTSDVSDESEHVDPSADLPPSYTSSPSPLSSPKPPVS